MTKLMDWSDARNLVEWGGYDPFGHSIIVGAPGTGKTSVLLKPLSYQAFEAYAKGNRVGVTIIEPKGDFSSDAADAARALNIPVMHIDPLRPDTWGLNPFVGEAGAVAEMMRTILRRLFGKQDAFFRQMQETAIQKFVLFSKRVHGDQSNLEMVGEALRDPEALKSDLKHYEKIIGKDQVFNYFRKDVMADVDKFLEFTKGLRAQLDDILGNDLIRKVLLSENTVALDRHLEEGGVLVVNTALGELGTLGNTFGQFALMSLQNAVFRRSGTEWTRRPHFSFVDELPLYVNPDVARMLGVGRSFRNACFLATQSLGDLNVEGMPNFDQVVLTNCRNKFVFGGMGYDDAERISNEMGKEKVVSESRAYESIFGFKKLSADRVTQRDEYKARFTPTQLMELPKFHYVCRLMVNNQPLTPKLIKGRFTIQPKVPTPVEEAAPACESHHTTDLGSISVEQHEPHPSQGTSPDCQIEQDPTQVQPELAVQKADIDPNGFDWLVLRKEKRERRVHDS